MPVIAAKLEALGLVLPKAVRPPAGVVLPFKLVHVRGYRVFVSGHGPLNPDGTLAPPLGKVGRDLSVEQGYRAARLTALAMLGSVERELGDLDRVRAWTRVFGMVNSAAGFNQQPRVMNGFSDLILELFGPECGAHSRCAVGMAELPFDLPVEIEAELEIDL
jgi:enamine deaminase RidA (YjgF/YER057c/UK114 family)